ncbi:ATP synthase F1 subunit gamma [Limibacter armeniacum]|uniref:ATP synthase F1 subunit gamma n=1 Tax=Limibacter armeniacum TaxID=466084 RepID=UPI002FE58D22
MAGLKEVKERIVSVKSTQQITKAMKMVAASKLRRAQDKITQMRPYSEKLFSILENVTSSLRGEVENPFAVEPEAINNVLIFVVTSDRGLCGGFNANIIKATKSLIAEKYAEQEKAGNVTLVCMGKKGYDHFRKRGYNIISDYVGIFQDLNFEQVKEAVEMAMDGFLNEKYDAVHVVYNEFKNVVTQIVHTDRFLPVAPAVKEGEAEAETEIDYIFEPEKEQIIKELIPKSLKISFYTRVLDSNAAEQGARMSSMDKATDNAGELIKELSLQYNRSRQAAITTEITEIVGGAAALANN